MKKIIKLSAILFGIMLSFWSSSALAFCGLKPLPPLGCSNSDAVCMCDSAGNCHWVWQCGAKVDDPLLDGGIAADFEDLLESLQSEEKDKAAAELNG